MQNAFWGSLLFLLVLPGLQGQDTRFSDTPIVLPMRQAIAQGVVQAELRGASDPDMYAEVLDGDGLHYGKCMALWVQNESDSLITLRLENGTLLVPESDSVQVMVVTHDLAFTLLPCEGTALRFYAMCTEIHKDAPWIGIPFRIGERADRKLRRLVRYLQDHDLQHKAAQHAVWAYTDKVGVDKLTPYGADSRSLAATRAILKAVGISTRLDRKESVKEVVQADSLPQPLPVIPERKAEVVAAAPETDTITLERSLVYGAGALLVTLGLSTAMLFVRRRRADGDGSPREPMA